MFEAISDLRSTGLFISKRGVGGGVLQGGGTSFVYIKALNNGLIDLGLADRLTPVSSKNSEHNLGHELCIVKISTCVCKDVGKDFGN